MILSSKISRYLIVFSIIVVASIILPEFYSMAFFEAPHVIRPMYSPVANEFVIIKFANENIIREDVHGNLLSREKFENLTPFFNYRQLIFREEMIDSFNGKPIDLQNVKKNNIFLSIRSTDISRYNIKLNPLLESQPDGPDLIMPDDYFRINDKFEFINCKTNIVEEKLSGVFNESLINEGFNFPAKYIFGNPTTRKPFDEGYFIVDNNDLLYHLKKINGNPYFKKIQIPSGMKIVYMAVREMLLKEFYGVIITEDNKVFIISYEDYQLIELPSAGYDKSKMKFTLKGTIPNRTILLQDDNSIKAIATDRDYNVIKTYSKSWVSNEDNLVGNISNYIFPFKLSFSDNNSQFVDFYFNYSDLRFLILSFILAIFYSLYRKNHNDNFNYESFIDIALIVITGIYGFIALLLISKEE